MSLVYHDIREHIYFHVSYSILTLTRSLSPKLPESTPIAEISRQTSWRRLPVLCVTIGWDKRLSTYCKQFLNKRLPPLCAYIIRNGTYPRMDRCGECGAECLTAIAAATAGSTLVRNVSSIFPARVSSRNGTSVLIVASGLSLIGMRSLEPIGTVRLLESLNSRCTVITFRTGRLSRAPLRSSFRHSESHP